MLDRRLGQREGPFCCHGRACGLIGARETWMSVESDDPGYTAFRRGVAFRIGLTLMRVGAGPMPALPIGLRRFRGASGPENEH